MRKKVATVTAHRELTVNSPWAHRELTVTKMVTASRDWAMTWAVIELWPSRDWAVIILRMPWLSCDLAVTELWPSRDWAVTSPWLSCDLSYDWAVIIGPGAVTTVVTVSSRWAHGDNFFLMGWYLEANFHQWFMLWTVWNRPMGPRVIRCTPSISNHLPTLRRLLLIKSTQAMSPTVINVFWCPAWRQAISNHHWRDCDLTVTWVILHEPRGVTLILATNQTMIMIA